MVISRLVPQNMNDLVLSVVKEVYSKSIGTISLSIIFTMWSAGRALLALTRGLHSVYNINDKKSNAVIYLRIKAIVETIMFIVFIVFGLVLLVFGDTLISIVKNHFGILENVSFFSGILAEIGFIFATFVVFLCLYKFLPKHKVSFRSQIPGAIFGAIGLNVISFAFSKYLDIFRGFSITYGSLTTLMLVMMWIYSCFYTVFLGAELNIGIRGRSLKSLEIETNGHLQCCCVKINRLPFFHPYLPSLLLYKIYMVMLDWNEK